MIKKVISGGQIGADIAGLVAAKEFGIRTGGHAPRGFKTLLGNNPSLGTDFGLSQTQSDEYPARTFQNVHNADFTLRFAENFNSSGEKCTAKAIVKYHKPYCDIAVRFDNWFPSRWCCYPGPENVVEQLIDNEVSILNISGNANEQIEPIVREFLAVVFKKTNEAISD